MSILSRLFKPKTPEMLGLWNWIVRTSRDPEWYLTHDVPDTIDGRFDMVSLVTALVMLRMEDEGFVRESARLTECFVEDMDGSLRDIGISDMVIGKHVGRMVGGLGGRIDGYRTALRATETGPLQEALCRNVFRGDRPAGADPERFAQAVRALNERVRRAPARRFLEGEMA